MSRAQSHVVGVAFMLGIGIVALGTLTAGVGHVIDTQTASADSTRVADSMDTALEAVSVTGPRTTTLRISQGTLETADRDLRVLRNGSVIAHRAVGELRFRAGQRRVAFLAGAIVRGDGSGAWLVREPPVTHSERNAVLVVGAPRLGLEDTAVSVRGGTRVALRTNVTHTRRSLGRGRYAVALETTTPAPFERYFERHNATVERRDFDADGVISVVARYPGPRRGYLVVHNLSLEVGYG